MATDVFKLRQIGEELPIGQQDIPSTITGQWITDFAAIHGRSPNADDRADWQWSLRFASQNGRGPEREDWVRHFYDELGKRGKPTTEAQHRRELTPEFVARPSSGIGRGRQGDLIVPFPWQADEPGAESTTDLTASFIQYDRWDRQRSQYARGTPEWNSLTTAMNQLQTSTAPWYFSFSPKFGLRDEILQLAGGRSGHDRVQVVANWIRQKQAQGIDPFNQADPYTQAYKAQAAQAQAAQSQREAAQSQRGTTSYPAGRQRYTGLPPTTSYPAGRQGYTGLPPTTAEDYWAAILAEAGLSPDTQLETGGRQTPVRFPELEGVFPYYDLTKNPRSDTGYDPTKKFVSPYAVTPAEPPVYGPPPPATEPDQRPEFLRRIERERNLPPATAESVYGPPPPIYGPPPATEAPPGVIATPGPRPIPGTPEPERTAYDPDNTYVWDMARSRYVILRDAIRPNMATARPAPVNPTDSYRSYIDYLKSLGR